MKTVITTVIATLAIAMVVPVPAVAEPVSDVQSESPFIDNFYNEIEARGYGYLDPAWKVNDAAWIACRVREAPGGTYNDAVSVVGGRGYSTPEATAIVESAFFHLCN